ncbi:putative amino-acid import ATP-binding protein YxeO [compost metagenome]
MYELTHSFTDGEEVLRLERLRKTYNPGTPLELEVLHALDLRLVRGELAALIGPSGSGKSTLLNFSTRPAPASCTCSASRPGRWTTNSAPICATR